MLVVRRQHSHMKLPKLYIPTTKKDLLRRCAVRIGFCTVPYLVLAWLWSAYRTTDSSMGFRSGGVSF